MALKIISAEQRMNSKKPIKGAIFGPHGIGKTSLLWTVNPDKTLFLNLEGGDLSVQDCPVDSINVESWEEAMNMACLITGPDKTRRSDQAYSQAHYDFVCQNIDPAFLDKYKTVFWDSISVASRFAWQWATGQPDAFSEKTGKPDNRGAYGLVGRELVRWLTHIQHCESKNVWVVGGLDEKEDDFGRRKYDPQIEGSKAGMELPGIFDEIISMVSMKADDGTPYRAFVCHTPNQWGYPAKDRSGRLSVIEKPHLGELMKKINSPKPDQNYQTTIPEGE
ncbi:MAG: ATP-binding protein [Desulfobacteraceae bacterium]|nr:ATP-binding protein [Desulfobacteraceae bacterium]